MRFPEGQSTETLMICAGLRSLDSVSGNHYYGQLMEKLLPGSSEFVSGRDSILIDLSSWYKESLSPKIAAIQSAIEEKRLISFIYYAPKGESVRVAEPYYLVFRWSSWYVWSWCKEKEDFRLFKLNRMEKLLALEERFEGREVKLPELSNEKIFPGKIRIKALFEKEMKWRLVEEFGADCFVEQPDGRLLFGADYTDEEAALSWLLTFGDKVVVLEPSAIQKKIITMAKNVQKRYLEQEGTKWNT